MFKWTIFTNVPLENAHIRQIWQCCS